MLKAMRKHAKFFYVLFFIVILSFIFWGVGTVDKSTGVPVAEIGKDRISVEEYWSAYDRAREYYRNVLKENFSEETEKKLNLRQRILDSLMDERILIAAAAREGLTVSDAEVEEAIVNDPAFLRDGKFTREVYIRTLQLSRLTPEYFEYAKRKELMVAKMQRLIEESVDISDVDMPQKGNGPAQGPLRQAVLTHMKQAAVRSYIEGMKQRMRIKVNRQIISG